jgi:hypothetical protein
VVLEIWVEGQFEGVPVGVVRKAEWMFTAGRGEQAEGSLCTENAVQRGKAGAEPSQLKP